MMIIICLIIVPRSSSNSITPSISRWLSRMVHSPNRSRRHSDRNNNITIAMMMWRKWARILTIRRTIPSSSITMNRILIYRIMSTTLRVPPAARESSTQSIRCLHWTTARRRRRLTCRNTIPAPAISISSIRVIWWTAITSRPPSPTSTSTRNTTIIISSSSSKCINSSSSISMQTRHTHSSTTRVAWVSVCMVGWVAVRWSAVWAVSRSPRMVIWVHRSSRYNRSIRGNIGSALVGVRAVQHPVRRVSICAHLIAFNVITFIIVVHCHSTTIISSSHSHPIQNIAFHTKMD